MGRPAPGKTTRKANAAMNDPGLFLSYGALFGSLLAGFGCGLLPLAAGYSRQRPYLGRGGLLLCFALGLAGGPVLALSAAIVLTLTIVLLGPPKRPAQAARVPVLLPQASPTTGAAPVPGDPAVRPSALTGFTDRGVILSCGQCGFMITAEGSRIPPWCPHCGADITRIPANAAPPPVPTEAPPSPVAVEAPPSA
jgi:hypothetical protein